MMKDKKKAVVLLSGGLDSTTTLAIAKSEGFELNAMTFRYGQRHEAEIEASRRVAERFGLAQHVVVEIDLRLFGGSALTADIAVPKGRAVAEMGQWPSASGMVARLPIHFDASLSIG
jgi:7-cyano-7-deazaguanine synthase